ncbi:MAG: DUF4968 domain-containing protein, partial [Candidatus Thorarchaeota archaeon]
MDFQSSENDLGVVIDLNLGDNAFEFFCSNGRLKVSVLGSKIIRIQATRNANYRIHESFARVPYHEEAQSTIEESNEYWIISSARFKVKITKNPISIRLSSPQGDCIFDLPGQSGMEWIGDSFVCRMKMIDETYFYGLGEKTHGLNKMGLRFEMWNTDNPDYDSTSDPLYQSIPFFIVLQKGIAHGVFLDNTYRTFFDFGHKEENFYQFGAPNGPLDFYIILGPEITEV